MRIASIIWCTEISGLNVYLFRRLSDDLKKNHLEGAGGYRKLLAPFVDSGHVSITESPPTIKFNWNGSKIFLCHCQYEKDVTKYQGAEIHVLLIDELTHFTDYIYRFLRNRVRLGGLVIPDKYKGLFPRILCGSNPGSCGHNWVKQTFVDYQPEMQISLTSSEEGGMMRQYIPARLTDNKALLDNDPHYADRLKGLGRQDLIDAMLNGDWDIVAGGMFDDLWYKDIHVIKPFKIPETWIIDRAYDWGSSKPYAVGYFAESDGCDVELPNGLIIPTINGDIFLIDEIYGWNGKANQGCKELNTETGKKVVEHDKFIKEKYNIEVRPGPADTAIYVKANGKTKSIAEDMEGVGCYWTDKADKKPGSRVAGAEKVREYLHNSVAREGPGLFIFNNCRHFIRTVPVLPRDEKKTDDVDTEAEDHEYDMVRYRLQQKREITINKWL